MTSTRAFTPRRAAGISSVVMASLLMWTALQAKAQTPGYDPGDKGTKSISSTTGTANGAGGDGYARAASSRWADALYEDIQPNEADTLVIWAGRAKKPEILNCVRWLTPTSFRLSAPSETVLRLSLRALGHTEKLAQNTLAVLAMVDGKTALTLTFKAKRFKAVTVDGDTTQWLSESQNLYVPIAEGAHVIEITDARRDSTVLLTGTFAVPNGEAPR